MKYFLTIATLAAFQLSAIPPLSSVKKPKQLVCSGPELSVALPLCCPKENKCHSVMVKGSFLYWYAKEEGLDIATNALLNPAGTLFFSTDTSTLFQNFDYNFGFKVELGYLLENDFAIFAEYTWLRTNNRVSEAAPTAIVAAGVTPATAAGATPVWAVNDWFIQRSGAGQSLSGADVQSNWELDVNLIDLLISRSYLQASGIKVSPFAGLLGTIIDQKLNVTLTESTFLFGPTTPEPIVSRNASNSWGIGPKAGLEVYAATCSGFRVEGNVGASLVYTRYTKVSHKEDRASTAFNESPYHTSMSGYQAVRPIVEMGLGVGYGAFVSDVYLDLSASYDFSYFWSQNMMRRLVDQSLHGSNPTTPDLYLHGLTVTARLDF